MGLIRIFSPFEFKMKFAVVLLVLCLAFAAQARNLAFEKARQDDCLACAGDIITAVENCNADDTSILTCVENSLGAASDCLLCICDILNLIQQGTPECP